MHGLGEIIKANKSLGKPYGEVSRNGHGTPWIVRWPFDTSGEKAFEVVRVVDGEVIGTHSKLSLARKQVATLMKQHQRSTP
jgi:hypothetical protein